MNFGRHHTSRLTAADRRGWSIVPRTRLYRRGTAGAAAAMLVSVALLAQTSVTSEATWNDAEWVNSEVGTSACTPDAEGFSSRGEGRALSGSVLGADLDAIAEAERVTVTNNGERVQATAGQPVQGIDSAFRDPLSVNVLSAIQAQLTGILELPADTNTGVVGQFGQAQTNGKSLGASGYVDNSGGIDLADEDTGEYPNLASLKLSELLNSDLLNLSDDQRTQVGSALSGIADVELEVGAVAGQASFDACESAWGDSGEAEARTLAASTAEGIVSGLDRNYLAASADLTFKSAAVGDLVSGLRSTFDGLQGTINSLLAEGGAVDSLAGGVGSLLDAVLGTVKLGGVTVNSLTATVDITPLVGLLSEPFSDKNGLVTIDPRSGEIAVDTAALLAQAYDNRDPRTLNGLPPNTDLLSEDEIVHTLTEALGTALEDWLKKITSTLNDQLDAIRVSTDLEIRVSLLLIPLVKISASVEGSLVDLLAGKIKAEAEASILGLPLLNGILGALVNGLGQTVGNVVSPLLNAVRVLPSAVTSLVNPVLTAVSRLYNGLFISNIVSITVNAQNRPSSGGPPPLDWIAGETSAPPEGQYEVAALRVGVLDGLGTNGVRLYLGRASVGPGCSPVKMTQPGSPCSHY